MTFPIKQDILARLGIIFKTQGVTSISGTYDGTNGTLKFNFLDGDEEEEPFKYTGEVVSEFNTLLMHVGGAIIRRYNTKFAGDSKALFLEKVTENEL